MRVSILICMVLLSANLYIEYHTIKKLKQDNLRLEEQLKVRDKFVRDIYARIEVHILKEQDLIAKNKALEEQIKGGI